MLCATYFAKLIPLYAGYPAGPVRLLPLIEWYATRTKDLAGTLSLLALLPAWIVLPLAGAVAFGAVLLAAALLRRISQNPVHQS
jgi:hypothetical protein